MSTSNPPETEDVKPRIRPFPLDVDIKESPRKPSAEHVSSKIVKKEASPIGVGLNTRSDSPIYISSDSDSQEVDAQMDANVPPAGAEVGDDAEDDDECGADNVDSDEGEQNDGEEGTDGTGDREKDTQDTLAVQDGLLNPIDAASKVVMQESKKTSLPPRASSSSLSPPPFSAFHRTKPRPKPVVASTSPSTSKKRSFISASQPARSSRQSAERLSAAPEPQALAFKLPDENGSEAEAPRRVKRARTESNSVRPRRNKASKRRFKHEKYWLLDGSVIVQLGDKLFRLHRSRLAQQSNYFQELFSQGFGHDRDRDSDVEDAFDFVDECPVYQVKNVSIDDFEALLDALDNAISYVYQPPGFSQLAAILRAARALSFTALEEFACRTLRKMWPTDLAKLSVDRTEHAAETIVLARDCEMTDLLKRSLYELLRTPQFGQDEDADLEDPEVAKTQISRRDYIRLSKTREELIARWIWTADSPPEIPCPLSGEDTPTEKGAICQEARANNLVNWHEQVKKSIFEDYLYDPLHGLQCLANVDWAALGYCDGCVDAWKVSWAAQRTKLWQQLDVWLGLPIGEPE